MNNIRKGIICMYVAMMVMWFCIGCSVSQDKPSEEVMKSLIIERNCGDYIKKKLVSNVKFEKFQITNSFFSKEKGGGGESTPYCIEVDYNMSYTHRIESVYGQDKIIKKNDVGKRKYYFVKRGNEWYVNYEWR